jgi:hypothetical protein
VSNEHHEDSTRDTPPIITEVDEKGDQSENYDDSDPRNHTGVDIDYVKHEFEGLRRRYSELSRAASQRIASYFPSDF